MPIRPTASEAKFDSKNVLGPTVIEISQVTRGGDESYLNDITPQEEDQFTTPALMTIP